MASSIDVDSMAKFFESLTDPRDTKSRQHLLAEIMVICVCGVMCNAAGPTAIARWAKANVQWLSRFLTLPYGVPAKDCIRRVLMAIDPQAFQECFEAWLIAVLHPSEGDGMRMVAVDGKSCRGSRDEAKGFGPLHLVSAWVGESGICLGQVATDAKSNEITAIPKLLSRIDLRNSIVTIDAMGCQTEIVEQIDKAKGVYVIAVKDNQPKLHAAIEEMVETELDIARDDLTCEQWESTEKKHGRIDERSYGLIKLKRGSALNERWPSVKAIGYAIRLTEDKSGNQTYETRYYILNRFIGAQAFARAVRGHWSIESMHWVLDVTFREDAQQTSERTLANNLSWLRKFAITMLKRGMKKGESIVGRMQMSGWNTAYLEKVLCGQ